MPIRNTLSNIRNQIRNQSARAVGFARARPRVAMAVAAAGAISLGALGTMAVRSFGDDSVSQAQGQELATGYVFDQRTQDEMQQNLERVAIHGREFYVERINAAEGQLPLRFIPFENSSRVHDLDSGVETIAYDGSCVPSKVRRANNTQNPWADKISLSTTYSPETGVRGLRADIPTYDELREQAGASQDSQGFSGKDVASYGVNRVEIFGENYFFPHVEASKTGDRRQLDFYLVPERGAQIRVSNGDGEITLENEDQVYRPVCSNVQGSVVSAGQAVSVN